MATPPAKPGSSNLDAVQAVAALADPTRAALYALIAEATEPVTREQAAGQIGISRKLAAFHLDKLVDARLLAADYPPGARARRLGRAPKAYRRSDIELDISIPDRRPAALAALLIDGVAAARPGEPAREAVLRAAENAGRDLGRTTRVTARPGRLGPERALTLTEAPLRERGYQPRRTSPTSLRLANCPFQPLTAQATELVCAINHRLLSGLAEGVQPHVIDAVLTPRSGECCVEMRAVADPS
jgi:predicted ArsR family transcriptional regulator